MDKDLCAASRRLEAKLHDTPVSGLNLIITQQQRQLTSTAGLDGAIRSVGTAQAALAQRAHREGAAIAAHFLADGSGAAGAPAGGDGTAVTVAACKVLKMGDCAMKRLRNGDIYKVCLHRASPHAS